MKTYESKTLEKITLIRNFIGHKIYSSIVDKYPKSSKCISMGGYTLLRTQSPIQYSIINSHTYKADERSMQRFSEDIVLSWITEDFASMLVYKKTGVELKLSGSDKHRLFERYHKVSNEADFHISLNNGSKVNIEFITDYYGANTRFKQFFLRNNKLPNLLESSRTNKTMIFCIDIKNNLYFLVDVNDLSYEPVTKYGKPSNKVTIDFPQYKITQENLMRDFGKLVNPGLQQ